MQIEQTAIPDVKLICPKVFGDQRGFFMEIYETRKFSQAGITDAFVQDNHSGSMHGTLRGLHYQIQHTQAKLVGVVAGEIYDVVVDLRKSSPTFGRWVGQTLSTKNRTQIWVPKGFAHGFYVMSEWAEVIYKVTDYYAPQWERSIAWNDPMLKIDWPILAGEFPILSAKDAQGKNLLEAELFE